MPVVRLVAFARLRELFGERREIALPEGAKVGDLWDTLLREEPHASALARGLRFARNGALCGAETALCEGDEISLLPPFGGG